VRHNDLAMFVENEVAAAGQFVQARADCLCV
jgi:hypothetical protein